MIVCGMSGGVDSSVAAHLLKAQGAPVRGVFMRNWDENDPGCRADADRLDALRVCAQLGLPYQVLDFQDEYLEQVFAAVLDGYARVTTPHPDILCNREIKFGVFLQRLLAEGAEVVATGHYARLGKDAHGNTLLLRALDRNKAQSYSLSAVNQAALRHARFPLGNLTKPQVRAIASDLNLPTSNKKDSTGICFIGERDFRDFLSTYLPASLGPIINQDGRVLGQHQGALYYTIGQRASVGGIKGAPQAPWFISEKRVATNTLVVVPGAMHPALLSDHATTHAPSWIVGAPPASEFECQVQLQHRGQAHPARVQIASDGLAHIQFAQPVRALAPGQQAVFYQDEVCLGGAALS